MVEYYVLKQCPYIQQKDDKFTLSKTHCKNHLIIPIIESSADGEYIRTVYMYEKDVRKEQKEAQERGWSTRGNHPEFTLEDIVLVEITD